MVKKFIPIQVYKYGCDFCDFVQIRDRDTMWKCKICGKDVCNRCKTWITISKYEHFALCPDCKNKDISGYIQIAELIRVQQDVINDLHVKQNKIIDEFKNKKG